VLIYHNKIRVTALCLILLAAKTAWPATVTVGKGSYTTTLPSSISSAKRPPATKYVTSNISGPVPTTKWYSSLISTAYSYSHYAYPLAMNVVNTASYTGLQLDQPVVVGTIDAVTATHMRDLEVRGVISGRDLKADSVKVDAFSDWTVTPVWQDSATAEYFKATYGHGLPFIYFGYSANCDPKITFYTDIQQVFDENGNIAAGTVNTDHLAVKYNDRYYGIFAPASSVFTVTNNQISIALPAGQRYMSIALITGQSSLAYFYQHAYAFVTATKVDWSYNESTNEVTTNFTVTTESKQYGQTNTLLALLPHQYKNSSAPVSSLYTYDILLGKMKLMEGNSFSTVNTFHGIIPFLPDKGNYDRAHLQALLNTDDNTTLAATDTYFNGKQMAKVANLLPIADQLGDTTSRDYLASRLKTVLVNWFTYTSGENTRFFYYDSNWGSLIGYDAQFAGYNFTDHHFHYGYMVYAAAMLSMYDPSFKDDYGPFVEYLIRDFANWRRDDTMFPFLRHFDPYMGHSYCDGLAKSDDGNNQESSSEAMNAWVGIILWGMVSNNQTIRDLGIWGYTTEYSGIHDYYLNIDRDIYPAAYQHTTVGILHDSKAEYATWWTGQAEGIYGIQMIPPTAGMLYLGYNSQYCQDNYNSFFKDNGGYEDFAGWYDILWKYQCFYNPDLALNKYSENVSIDTDGDSFTFLYHWLYNFQALGKVDTGVTANSPYYAAFDNNGSETYLAYNPDASVKKVTFSGPAGSGSLYVQAKSLSVAEVFACEVSKITASSSQNSGLSILTIEGSGFKTGVTVYLQRTGQATLTSNSVTLNGDTKITATMDLTGLMPGEWQLAVVNPGGNINSAVLNTFLVSANAPRIDAINPVRAANGNNVELEVTGVNFFAGLVMKLVKNGEADISATEVNIPSSERITGRLDIKGKSTGLWDLAVINSDGQAGTLAGALEITGDRTIYAFPNPCRPARGQLISFANVPSGANLRIFGLTGDLVFSRDDLEETPFAWNLENNAGEKVASGVYIYTLDSGGSRSSGKIAIIR